MPEISPKGQLVSQEVLTTPFTIRQADPGGVQAQPLNVDGTKGLMSAITHIMPGARFPSHCHNDGVEAHYASSNNLLENSEP